MRINEYGVFKGRARVAGETEESVFATVGLSWIAPELHEDKGEIEAARSGKLPTLVERTHLRGDLHVHTKASDGRNTLREMALAAQAAGLSYVAITDHSSSLRIARGLDSSRLSRHLDAIDRLNAERVGMVILKGAEVDIFEDGSLDYADATLAKLDIVVAAIHSHFGLRREKQTQRVLRAMDYRHFMVLAHPSCRLIGTREGIDIDLERVIRRARERRCFLELNAQPERLDLDDRWWRAANAESVLVSLSSDAHEVGLGVRWCGYGAPGRGSDCA